MISLECTSALAWRGIADVIIYPAIANEIADISRTAANRHDTADVIMRRWASIMHTRSRGSPRQLMGW